LKPFCHLRQIPRLANPFGFARNRNYTAYFAGLCPERHLLLQMTDYVENMRIKFKHKNQITVFLTRVVCRMKIIQMGVLPMRATDSAIWHQCIVRSVCLLDPGGKKGDFVAHIWRPAVNHAH